MRKEEWEEDKDCGQVLGCYFVMALLFSRREGRKEEYEGG